MDSLIVSSEIIVYPSWTNDLMDIYGMQKFIPYNSRQKT